ncbi:carboxypeptidase B-like [Penaeus japonicus]|uniref:carboxypeptidase B-like n=1 Tax=Penaeus japonicus TaxID=27405 RepID=UPI001C713AEF|nr:carboxypeptidase B-like [Penaeus japonicus]
MATGRRAALPLLLWLAFSLAGALPYEPNAKYNGWQVLQVPLEGESPEELVREFHNLEDSNVLQVLRVSRGQDDTEPGLAEIAVSPSSEKEIKNMMRKKGLAFTTVISDLATKLSVDEPSLRRAALLRGAITFERFMNFEEIQAYVEDLPNLYPGRVKVKELGRSAENRPILMVVVQSGSARRSPVLFVDGGMHAREWVSPAAATYLVGRLLESPDLTRDVEWRVIPLLNPDGYVYSWTNDRMWRKNRGATRSALCTGVDINRNFDYHWGESGSSNRPCSSIFQGSTAFSEPEAIALKESILDVKKRVKAYVSLHAYGQYILHPWGYRRVTPINSDQLAEVGKGMADEIRRTQGSNFAVGSSAKLLYPAAGASDDWALGVAKVPLSYTLELRDEGAAGFVLPPHQIIPAVNEAWAAMKFLGEYVAKQESPTREADNSSFAIEQADSLPAGRRMQWTRRDALVSERHPLGQLCRSR